MLRSPRLLSLGAFVLLATFALALSFSAWALPRLPGDLSVAQLVQRDLAQGSLPRLMDLVGLIHEPAIAAVGVLGAIILVVRRRWLEALTMVVLIGSMAEVPVLKALVGRPRPDGGLIHVAQVETNGSFPSGHTYVAVTVLGGMIASAPAWLGGQSWLIWSARLVLVALIVLIGVSRLCFGAHWPSDVIGAVALGLLTLRVVGYAAGKLRAFAPHGRAGGAKKSRPASSAKPGRAR